MIASFWRRGRRISLRLKVTAGSRRFRPLRFEDIG